MNIECMLCFLSFEPIRGYRDSDTWILPPPPHTHTHTLTTGNIGRQNIHHSFVVRTTGQEIGTLSKEAHVGGSPTVTTARMCMIEKHILKELVNIIFF